MAQLLSKPTTRKARKPIRATGSLRHIATRIFNVPLLIQPEKLQAILAVVGPRLGLAPEFIPKSADFGFDNDGDDDAPEQADSKYPDGLCVLPIYGTLVKRASGMDALSGMTSYEAIQADIDDAMNDPSCTAIVCDFDSPGGEAAGMFDLATYLTSLRGQKPLVGIANDHAYSAAYALASCMDRLLVTTVGGTGSVGVVMMHCDQSGYDKDKGLKYSYIFSGDHKVDWSPHQALSKETIATAQAECDSIRQMFVQLVARNRSVDAQAVYDTQARTYMGNAGLPLLADGVGTLDDACSLALSMVKGARSFSVPQFKADPRAPVLSELAHMETLLKDQASVQFEFDTEGDGKILAKRQMGTLRLDVREAGSEAGFKKSAAVITGLLAPYNSLSCDLGGFREIYQPGCFKECLESGEDMLVLGFHNPENVLGRSANGTARFWEDADGLHYEADLPDTQFARDLKTLINRGDIKGSSAAFYILQHRWEQRPSGRVRIIEKAKLVEGSPHSLVAYENSTAQTVVQEDQLAAIHDETELIQTKVRKLRLS